jgi:hypothetical protein
MDALGIIPNKPQHQLPDFLSQGLWPRAQAKASGQGFVRRPATFLVLDTSECTS